VILWELSTEASEDEDEDKEGDKLDVAAAASP